MVGAMYAGNTMGEQMFGQHPAEVTDTGGWEEDGCNTGNDRLVQE